MLVNDVAGNIWVLLLSRHRMPFNSRTEAIKMIVNDVTLRAVSAGPSVTGAWTRLRMVGRCRLNR